MSGENLAEAVNHGTGCGRLNGYNSGHFEY